MPGKKDGGRGLQVGADRAVELQRHHISPD